MAERVIPNLDFIVEGKDLAASAKSFHGAVSLQKGWDWTGEGQLFFDAKEADAWVGSAVRGEGGGAQAPRRALTHSYDFGIYRVSLDGKPIGDAIDFYSAEVAVHELSLGDQTLPVGAHTIRFECAGKNPASRGYKLGIDSVRLRQRYPAKR